ncbi:hypothetical protein BB560_000594 [Smittium megazygosporum]|uniref:Uncharacterized protein n=1 Tax=Smittium megazygosporum TaxID=133381 RepID=A0A2T9ZJY8_9FUNG|nr:hypothetical protein BB560_000594 [Smittium megazygosporum]
MQQIAIASNKANPSQISENRRRSDSRPPINRDIQARKASISSRHNSSGSSKSQRRHSSFNPNNTSTKPNFAPLSYQEFSDDTLFFLDLDSSSLKPFSTLLKSFSAKRSLLSLAISFC